MNPSKMPVIDVRDGSLVYYEQHVYWLSKQLDETGIRHVLLSREGAMHEIAPETEVVAIASPITFVKIATHGIVAEQNDTQEPVTEEMHTVLELFEASLSWHDFFVGVTHAEDGSPKFHISTGTSMPSSLPPSWP